MQERGVLPRWRRSTSSGSPGSTWPAGRGVRTGLRTRGTGTSSTSTSPSLREAVAASPACGRKSRLRTSSRRCIPILYTDLEKDAFTALGDYRDGNFIEAGKQKADGTRTRVWNTDRLRGRMFMQFIALCYYEHYSEQLRQSLAKELGNLDHNRKENLNLEARLKS